MDFKTRFQGKMSKITKDGDVEGNPANLEEPSSKQGTANKNDRLNESAAKQTGNSFAARLTQKSSVSRKSESGTG